MQSDVMQAGDLTADDATGCTHSANYSCMGRLNDSLKRGPKAEPFTAEHLAWNFETHLWEIKKKFLLNEVSSVFLNIMFLSTHIL